MRLFLSFLRILRRESVRRVNLEHIKIRKFQTCQERKKAKHRSSFLSSDGAIASRHNIQVRMEKKLDLKKLRSVNVMFTFQFYYVTLVIVAVAQEIYFGLATQNQFLAFNLWHGKAQKNQPPTKPPLY